MELPSLRGACVFTVRTFRNSNCWGRQAVRAAEQLQVKVQKIGVGVYGSKVKGGEEGAAAFLGSVKGRTAEEFGGREFMKERERSLR